MTTWFNDLHPIAQAFLAKCFTWGMTALGAALVFLCKEMSRLTLDVMLGFAAGVMVAASYWSLLARALAMSEGKLMPAWFPAAVGFMAGGLMLRWATGFSLIFTSSFHSSRQKVCTRP